MKVKYVCNGLIISPHVPVFVTIGHDAQIVCKITLAGKNKKTGRICRLQIDFGNF